MNVILRRDGYPIVPLSAAERHARDPLVRRQKELQQQREEEERRKAREPKRDTHGLNWATIDQRIFDYVMGYLMGKDGPLLHVIAEAMAVHREQRREEAKRLVEAERRAVEAKLAALEERLKAVPGKLPVAKVWQPESVTYQAEFVSHNGALFQARKDTAQAPGGPDWICVARSGRDGRAAPMLNFRGMFDVDARYAKFDVIEYAGGGFIATRDNPALIPGEDGWQVLALPGGRGPEGAVGPQGRKGERGPRGADAPQIVNWTIDWKNYRVVPTMSNGVQGAVLDLLPLFERFSEEFVLGAVDQAMQDAKTKLLSPY